MAHATFPKYASVVLDLAIDKALDYGIPADMLAEAQCGTHVEIPVRGRLFPGYIIAIKDQPDFSPVKPIARILTKELIPPSIFNLALWMAKYYCTPLRQVLKMMLPSSIRGNMQHKQQLFVMRAKTREELSELCVSLRNKSPAQAAVLDVMLQVSKGILLTELLEKTGGSRSPVDSLATKGALLVDIVRIDRSPLVDAEYLPTKPKTLNPDQAEALKKVIASLEQQRFDTHLLFGITGSGKTEVYLQAIEATLKRGKGVIMLVPEIALTTQTIERFRSRFEGLIAILHYRLSQGERCDEWHKIHRGEARIVIGARSAIFSPVNNLGLIIVDEEHETSYKQSDEMPCYHARDVAVMRAKQENCAVILGSATPSLESYYNAQNGKYILSMLHSRADAASLPKVTIVDMKKEFEKNNGYTNFSGPLIDGIKKRQELGEQSLLFLNRRGYHTTLFCQQCSNPVRCRHCDVALTFHLGEKALSCHLCGFTISPPPTSCPECHSPNPMKFRGVGTEQIEKALHAILPGIRTLRIDADTTKHKGSHQKLFRAFATGKADVVIGTQMIAKGLHFPQVTLVGVLNSDSSLNIPDFRASETVFQLITQVAGRSGRGVLAGEVIVQTCMPDNSTILHASKQDYEGFFKEELAVRELFHYPPLAQMAKIAFAGEDRALTLTTAEQMRSHLIGLLPAQFELHPVVPAGHAKVKDLYRLQFLVRGPNISVLNRALIEAQTKISLPKGVRMKVDVNPSSTFF
ncbi:MAG: primosomal protein N' [Parachlamydiaceae bacterium]|nr:primosomal protein N' [Parachlamydiaceae bacterium]